MTQEKAQKKQMYNNNNNLGKKKQYTRIHYYIQEYK